MRDKHTFKVPAFEIADACGERAGKLRENLNQTANELLNVELSPDNRRKLMEHAAFVRAQIKSFARQCAAYSSQEDDYDLHLGDLEYFGMFEE